MVVDIVVVVVVDIVVVFVVVMVVQAMTFAVSMVRLRFLLRVISRGFSIISDRGGGGGGGGYVMGRVTVRRVR